MIKLNIFDLPSGLHMNSQAFPKNGKGFGPGNFFAIFKSLLFFTLHPTQKTTRSTITKTKTHNILVNKAGFLIRDYIFVLMNILDLNKKNNITKKNKAQHVRPIAM